ncbi:MAG TPA: HAMP domain-containing sensor histidine kinase, partial [Vulgatibacter sp.]
RVHRLGGAVMDVSLGLVLLLPFAVLWLLRAVRGGVYLPFLGLHRALARYSAGETKARAVEGGPPEVADMARSFNRLADSLDQQRQTRFEFLMAVAHDLRNPLAALKATVALTDARMRKGELTMEQLEQQQKRMAGQVDRLNRMVGDLLDMTRVEAGRFDLTMATCDVRSFARDAQDLFEEASARHPIRLSLPEEPVPVACDRQRLGQVLDNLLSNAIKYSPDGGEIDVRVTCAAGEARIEVQDRGSGIAPENFSRIFEPFQRLQRDRTPGVGLGLSVAKRLVEAQGGRIELESEVGVGSTFRVCLPLAAYSHAAACAEAPSDEART